MAWGFQEKFALGLVRRGLQTNGWERKGCVSLLFILHAEFLRDVKPAKALPCITWHREHLDGATLICFLEVCEAVVY